jgi:hypothetical protein
MGRLLSFSYINDLPGLVTSKVRLNKDCLALQTTRPEQPAEKGEDLDDAVQSGQTRGTESQQEASDTWIHRIIGITLATVNLRVIIKYLRLNSSHNLSCNTHIDSTTKKANDTLAFLKKNHQLKVIKDIYRKLD